MKARNTQYVRIVVAVAAVLATGCGGAAQETSSAPSPITKVQNVSAGSLASADAIPAPKQDAILDVSGKISKTNSGKKVELDLPTLEQMPLVELRVFEPFEKKNMIFEGVLMSDLMDIVGADTTAQEAHFTALDDYEFDIPLEEFSRSDVLLATKADGQRMSIADGGPIRIVFPSDSELGQNTDAWIWNVETIVIR